MSQIVKPHGDFQVLTLAEAAKVNNQINTIYADYNGNINDANIAAGANIQQSKILNLLANLATLGEKRAFNFNALNYTIDVATGFTTYQTFAGLSLPLTTNGGTVLVAYTGPGSATVVNGHFTISQDLVDTGVMAFVASGSVNIPISIITAFVPSAGVHSYTLRGKCAAGGGTLFQNSASAAFGFMIAVELKV